jgi:bacillithiol biosynthesis cysteine-adding enzyme BshC
VYSECLPFSNIPHSSRLFLEFLHYTNQVQQFYPRSPYISEWAKAEAARIRYDDERRKAVADVLERQNHAWGWSQKTANNLKKFREGAAVVVTGQQVGVFGGPLFAILKAMTAVELAAKAEAAGVPTVPIFWLATEDHDLEEVSKISFPGADGSLQVVEIAPPAIEDSPVGDVRLGPEITAQVERVAELMGSSDVTDALVEAYRPGTRMGDAFAKLYSKIFAEWGVILIDGYDPELHRIAKPIYKAAAENAEEIDQLLLDRDKELENAGYHQQVKVTASSTLLFEILDGKRSVIQRSNGGFKAGTNRYSKAELLQKIDSAPETFSANVLLRPVVQDYLLPTLAYTGGPAEVAYFAQVAVVYEKLLNRVTPVMPRFSATVVNPKMAKLLEKYRLKVVDLFVGPEALQIEMARRVLPVTLQSNLQNSASVVRSALERIKNDLEKLDPTLIQAANRAESKMLYQVDRLGQRAARAELVRNEILSRHASSLSSNLFPHKNLQEREIGGVYFVAQHGLELLHTLYEAARTECPDHQVIYL